MCIRDSAGIDSVIKNFLVSVPAVSELKSPAMRQRHWDKLMTITGASIAVADGKFDPAFCLGECSIVPLKRRRWSCWRQTRPPSNEAVCTQTSRLLLELVVCRGSLAARQYSC